MRPDTDGTGHILTAFTRQPRAARAPYGAAACSSGVLSRLYTNSSDLQRNRFSNPRDMLS